MSNIVNIKTSGLITSAVYSSSATVASDKTFGPEGFRSPGVARWVDRSGGIEIGYPSVEMSLRRPVRNVSGEPLYKSHLNLLIPTLETTSPSTLTGIEPRPTMAYSLGAKIETLVPARSTDAERVLLISTLISLLYDTIQATDNDPIDTTGSLWREMVRNFVPPF